jgi:uncharacterized protein (DUF362 family)
VIFLSLVSLIKMAANQDVSYSFRQAIVNSLVLINYTVDRNIKRVVIKPNLCYYWDCTTGQTTDPRFVGALIDYIREQTRRDVEIAIVESDASAMRCKYAFRMLGYERLVQEKNVSLVNLSKAKAEKVEVSCNNYQYEFRVPKIISEADLRIGISKIKYTVDPIKLTCALKNMYGCNPDPKKYQYHANLGNVIVALNKIMKFNLFLIEDFVASGVQPRKLGLTMASLDPLALDVAAAKIAWLNPRRIGYFRVAEREGVGSRRFVIKGEPLEYFKMLYPKRSFSMKVKGRLLKLMVATGVDKRLGLN